MNNLTAVVTNKRYLVVMSDGIIWLDGYNFTRKKAIAEVRKLEKRGICANVRLLDANHFMKFIPKSANSNE